MDKKTTILIIATMLFVSGCVTEEETIKKVDQNGDFSPGLNQEKPIEKDENTQINFTFVIEKKEFRSIFDDANDQEDSSLTNQKIGEVCNKPNPPNNILCGTGLTTQNLEITLLATVPKYFRMENFVFSPNGQHVAYHAWKNYPTKFIVVNNVEGENQNFISNIQFNEDGQKLAYEVNHSLVMVEGKERKQFDSILPGEISDLTLSPNGNHIAFVLKTWASLSEVKETPNSENSAFLLTRGIPDYYLVVDDNLIKSYSVVKSPLFSPDSKNLAFIAQESPHQFVVINGEEGKKYNHVEKLAYSPDSKHIAYYANNGLLVIDDKEVAGPGIDNQFLTFSPNSKSVAYLNPSTDNSTNPKITFLDLDGKLLNEINTENQVQSFIFTKDNNEIAYIFQNENQEKKTNQVSYNGTISPRYDYADNLTFIPKNNQLLYRVQIDEQMHLVKDYEVGPAFDWVGPPHILEKYNKIGYGIRKENELWWVVEEMQ